jgi:alkaline phosphatase
MLTAVAVYYGTRGRPLESDSSKLPKKRNVIFMVSDGMGPASLSLTRSFRQFRDQLPIDDILTLDKHVIGQSRTRSSDTLITDSAAGATAFSCGLKTYNGAIGMTPEVKPCGTVLEAAKLAGYMTGLVVTTRVTDATPASFAAHANYRTEEDLIALHELGEYPLGRMVDLIIGGGRCHFLPPSVAGGCRADERNLVDEAKKSGWQYVENRAGWNALDGGDNVTLPLLALMAPRDIPYEIDRIDEVHPSLEETTKLALRSLERATRNSDKGFFVLIEGSRIDHAGHQNDPAAQVREVLAYDAAFRAATEFASSSDVETIVISTSDHETGGLATALQLTSEYPEYLWYPEALLNATRSAEFLTNSIRRYDGKDFERFVLHDVLHQGLGIPEPDEVDVQQIVDNLDIAADVIADIVSRRSQTGWSTHGHSAVDVNIYASAPRHRWQDVYEALGGSHENTDIGHFLAHYLDVDIQSVTDMLRHHHTPNGTFEWTAESVEEVAMDTFHVHVNPADKSL